jgi:hypothetical protein
MSEISVSVVGGSTINPTVGNGDVVNVTIASTGERGPSGSTGPAGPANTLTIGTVTQGTAAATITGTSPNQVLNLVLQKGDAGTPATNIELQATATHLQWRLVGASSWTNLVTLSAITGPTGSTGAAGTAVELQASVTHIQWRYVGGSSWTNVVALSSLVGATGATGATGPQGPAGTANLADETPQPLGTASAGSALTAARADHVHASPTIAYSSLTGVPSTFSPSAHSHAIGDVTGLQTALDGKQPAGTYATLVGGTVPSSMLPSFVDDVREAASLSAFPASGDAGVIYVAVDTKKIYRWSGSSYVEISPSPGSTDSVTEGSTNLYYTNARAAAAAPVQSIAGRTGTVTLAKSDVGLGSVDNTADASKPVSTAQAAADAAVQEHSIQRANHTGTQAISTVSGLQTAIDGKASSSHTHSLADISQSSATSGQVPTWNGTAWAAATPSSGSGSYTLPTASNAVLGGIKVGEGLSINSGVLSATGPSVIVESTSANFPATGKTGNLYIASVAKTISYWTGSEYVTLGGSSSGGGGVTPDAPTGLTGTAGDSQISLSWTAPAVVGSSAITGYSVEYTPSGGSPTAVNTGSTSTSYTLTGLTNGTAYTVRAAAKNAAGTGTYTAASSAITPTGQVFRAIPTLTSNTSDGTAEANTVAGGAVWNLFDNSASEYYTSRNGSDTPKRYFQYSFAGGAKSYIGGYSMTAVGSASSSIYSWEFSGSNDGTTFTLLDTQSTSWSSGGQTKTFTLASTANYSTYRWTLTPDGTNDSFAGLRAVQLTEVVTSKLTVARRNGSPSTFTGAGTAASPFTRASRVLNSNADGLASASTGSASGVSSGAYAFTATASGTAYVTVTFYDDDFDGWVGTIKKNGVDQGGVSLSDGQTATAMSFAVSAGDVITFYSGNSNTSFSNVSVWVV